jgi:molybdopterin/thiamine biosynthesis adenylyltransferase
MNLNKHYEFFNPTAVKQEIHIIGCGAIGSTVAEMLTRLGFQSLYLYDFDKVSDHNITNQMFRMKDIGCFKVDALEEILKDINPDIKVNKCHTGWDEYTRLSGIVFIAVDNIELRKQIVESIKYNKAVTYVTDCRMRLTDAQCYAADWSDDKAIETLLSTMQFTSEEAKEATPISACGTTLSVTPTVRTIVSLCVSNLINFVKHNDYKTMLMLDAFAMNIVCFPE